MKSDDLLPIIRGLYSPVQPTVKQCSDHIVYQELAPDYRIQNYVYCYWQLRTTKPLNEHYSYRVVADGCMDIYFDLNSPEESYVMGFCKQYTEFHIGRQFSYIGIRFLPTVFPQLFKTSASDLSDRYEKLNTISAALADYISSRITASQQLEEIKHILDRYFFRLVAKVDFDNDTRLYNAIRIILENCGAIDIEKDLDTGLSARQLRRKFDFYVGDTAKSFSKVVRFQNILRAKPSIQSLQKNKIFSANGYYDQSHFIKEFKNFYGGTPARAFRE